jgi:hypothetical protein
MHRKRLDCYDEHKVIFYIFIWQKRLPTKSFYFLLVL